MLYLIVLLAGLSLAALGWALVKARRYTKFCLYLTNEIKPLLIQHITEQLEASRCELLPNSAEHIKATHYYWTCHKIRILQGALHYEILNKEWLANKQNKRNAQHLLHVERAFQIT
jgi:hypothetical protein